jgi:protein-tyrosine phosphatase
MLAEPYWINTQIAIIPRPRGGDWLDDEMVALSDAGIDIVVSMLEESEATDLGLEREKVEAEHARLGFVNFPIPDRGVPGNNRQFQEFLTGLEEQIESGKKVGVHCRACIGRASVAAASLLIRSGVPATEAWHQVAVARGFPVPDTQEQRDWVDQNVRSIH